MSRVHRLLTAVMLAVICFSAEGARAFADAEDPVRRILAAGQQAMLERHFAQAIRIFRNGLKSHPEDQQLHLELGRAYLADGEDGLAIRLFREILRTSPGYCCVRTRPTRRLPSDWPAICFMRGDDRKRGPWSVRLWTCTLKACVCKSIWTVSTVGIWAARRAKAGWHRIWCKSTRTISTIRRAIIPGDPANESMWAFARGLLAA